MRAHMGAFGIGKKIRSLMLGRSSGSSAGGNTSGGGVGGAAGGASTGRGSGTGAVELGGFGKPGEGANAGGFGKTFGGCSRKYWETYWAPVPWGRMTACPGPKDKTGPPGRYVLVTSTQNGSGQDISPPPAT